MDSHRKILIYGINELLSRKLITLNPPGEYSSAFEENEKGHHFVDLLNYPSVILWSNVGFQELRVSVWWKYDHSLHPQAELTGNAKENFLTAQPLAKRQHYKKFVGVTVSGWLERKDSKHLQGKQREALFDIYTRAGEKDEMEKFPIPKPAGYKAEGQFYI
jgi:hypothetical protein